MLMLCFADETCQQYGLNRVCLQVTLLHGKDAFNNAFSISLCYLTCSKGGTNISRSKY